MHQVPQVLFMHDLCHVQTTHLKCNQHSQSIACWILRNDLISLTEKPFSIASTSRLAVLLSTGVRSKGQKPLAPGIWGRYEAAGAN